MDETEVITKAIKIDADNISIEKTKTISDTISYNYSFLIANKNDIIADAASYAIERQKEIDKIDLLLAECAKVGVGS